MPPKPKNDQNISQNLKNDGNTLETKKMIEIPLDS